MNGNRWLLHLALLCCLANTVRAQSQLKVQLITSEAHPFFGAIEIQGHEAVQLSNDICKVYTEPPNNAPLPMLGKLIAKDNLLYFKPRFPFIEGRTYWVELNISETPILQSILIPETTPKTPPKVLAIYPTASKWYANQLKFYICFDQPMRFGEAYQNIQIIDENGNPIATPFLELEQELWNKEQTRLTVWFDPGRIKQSLIPNQTKGIPLQQDRKYQLIIKKDWLAINGMSLQADYQKSFEVISADHSQPNPANWEIKAPHADTKEALSIIFSESMDYAMLLSGIGILNEQDQVIPGRIELADAEKTWRFYPTEPWKSGNYMIRVSTDMEDLAGNNLERLFDSEYQKGSKKPEKSYIDLKVIIK